MGKASERRIEHQRHLCSVKRQFATWDEAESEALRLWREFPRDSDTNPAGAYPCLFGDHFHIGHLSLGRNAPPGLRSRR